MGSRLHPGHGRCGGCSCSPLTSPGLGLGFAFDYLPSEKEKWSGLWVGIEEGFLQKSAFLPLLP